MRKKAVSFIIGVLPYFVNMLLQSSEGFFFRNAGIRNAVVMIFKQVPFLLRTKITIVWYPLIMAMCNQVHNIFFEISAGTTDDCHFILPDHFGKAQTQFRST